MRETGFEPVSPETAVLKTAGITELTDSRYNIKHFIFFSLHKSNHILKNNKNSKNAIKNRRANKNVSLLLFSYFVLALFLVKRHKTFFGFGFQILFFGLVILFF